MHLANPHHRPLLRLQPGSSFPPSIHAAIARLPELHGPPIKVSLQPSLTVYRGKLLSGHPANGTPVHAACFLRRRSVILESSLLRRPAFARLILIHELFHFVWLRFGNQSRRSFTELLHRELAKGARGELGESAAVKKDALRSGDAAANHARWRDYVCESFCDTAAWRYAGVSRNAAFTLNERWQKARQRWWQSAFPGLVKC